MITPFYRSTAILLAMLVGLLALALPAGTAAVAQDGGNRVHAVLLPGTQLFPIAIMKLMGQEAKHDLTIDEERLSGVGGMFVRAQGLEFHVMFMTPTNAPTFRAQGVDLLNVFATSGFSHQLFVKTDSPLRSWADLRGKTVGMVGSAAATSTQYFQYQIKKYYGIDFDEYEVRFAAPGLLGGMLERGDIDTALLLEPLASQFVATGEYRSIGGLGTVYAEMTGKTPPPYINVVMNAEWARDNADLAKRFLVALREALVYLREHPEVWPALAAEIGVEEEAAVNLLRERVGEALFTEWNQEIIDSQKEMIKDAMEILPADQIPFTVEDLEESYTLEYAP